MKRIMVATDGSDGASRAVDFAAELAHELDAELIVATAAGNLTADQMRKLGHAEQDIGSVLDSAAERIASAAAKRAAGKGASAISRCVLWDGPAEAIIAESSRKKVDLIVVGRRGRGQLTGLLLGSVSQKLVSLANCPVIVVP